MHKCLNLNQNRKTVFAFPVPSLGRGFVAVVNIFVEKKAATKPVSPPGRKKDSRRKVNRHRLNTFLKCLFSWQLNKNNNYKNKEGRKGYGTPNDKNEKSLLWIGTKLSFLSLGERVESTLIRCYLLLMTTYENIQQQLVSRENCLVIHFFPPRHSKNSQNGAHANAYK